jgi:hypothetical protein
MRGRCGLLTAGWYFSGSSTRFSHIALVKEARAQHQIEAERDSMDAAADLLDKGRRPG